MEVYFAGMSSVRDLEKDAILFPFYFMLVEMNRNELVRCPDINRRVMMSLFAK